MGKMNPLFLADWREVVFIHFRMDPRELQKQVPFELDLFDGKAYLSLVAFRQMRLRPATGGRLGEVLSQPLSDHEFLNLRTYVRVGHTRGIYFISEWIPNRLASLIGPAMYGLPYRLGKLRYFCDAKSGVARGTVSAGKLGAAYEGTADASAEWGSANPGSLDEFLVERYSAFTQYHGVTRRFDIQHEPWRIRRMNVSMIRTGLLQASVTGLIDEKPALAHLSAGLMDVRIGYPEKQTSPPPSGKLWQRRERGAEQVCPRPMSIPPT